MFVVKTVSLEESFITYCFAGFLTGMSNYKEKNPGSGVWNVMQVSFLDNGNL